MSERAQWWGFVHVNGTLNVKRVLPSPPEQPSDMDVARKSPFVRELYGPFPADGRDDAMAALRNHADRAAIDRLHAEALKKWPQRLHDDWIRVRVRLREIGL